MAARKPLVLNAGLIEQLQSGDTLDAAVSEVDVVTLTNNSAATINICMPVFCGGANQANAAVASAAGSAKVIGLAAETSADEATISIQTNGIFTANTTQWDAVGGSSGLTAGATYYLDDAATGNITATAPTASGNYVTAIGVALSSTVLLLNIQRPIKL